MDTPEGRLCKRGDEAPFDSAPRVKNPFVSGTRSVSIRCCAIPISEEGGEGMERVVGSGVGFAENVRFHDPLERSPSERRLLNGAGGGGGRFPFGHAADSPVS